MDEQHEGDVILHQDAVEEVVRDVLTESEENNPKARRAGYTGSNEVPVAGANLPFDSLTTPWSEVPFDLTDPEHPVALVAGMYFLNVVFSVSPQGAPSGNVETILGVTFDDVVSESQYCDIVKTGEDMVTGGGDFASLNASGFLGVGDHLVVSASHDWTEGLLTVSARIHVTFIPCDAEVLA